MEYDDEEWDLLIKSIHSRFMKKISKEETRILGKLLEKHIHYKINILFRRLKNGEV